LALAAAHHILAVVAPRRVPKRLQLKSRPLPGAWMSIWVDDVDAVHQRCLEQGLDVTWPPVAEDGSASPSRRG
jgi:hypothetical protein